MAYHTGFNQRKIKSFKRIDYIFACADARKEGYELHKASMKIDWPRFWQRKYKAEYRKYYIIEDSKIAFFQKSEIERIKTGIVK